MTIDAAKRAKIIEKVRALLSMTTKNGCTEAEAMTAAAMASKLMEEHDLELSDVKTLQDERIAQQSKPFSSTERPREMHAAGIYVAVAVAEFFDCKCWRNYTEIIFFGLRDDVELAHAMLAMIRFAMDRELSDFMRSDAARSGEHPKSLSGSFMRGMGHRISERLRQLKTERTANVRAKGKDLIVVKGSIVDAALAAQYPDFKKARPERPAKSAVAYSAGFAAGDRVNIGHKELGEAPAAMVRTGRRRAHAALRPYAAHRRSFADLARHLAVATAEWIVRAVSAFAIEVIRLLGWAGVLANVLMLTAATGTGISQHDTLFFVWMVDRQPALAAALTACIAFAIRIERLNEKEDRELLRGSARRTRWQDRAYDIGSSALHVVCLAVLCVSVYFGNKLAPELWEAILAQPAAAFDQPFGIVGKLMSVIMEQAGLRPTMLVECAVSATAGYFAAARVLVLRRISLT